MKGIMVAVIWDLTTMGNVRRLWTEAKVTDEADHQSAGAAIRQTKTLAARSLVVEARTFGVDAHEDDAAFSITHDDNEFLNIIRAYWQPTTTEVILRGGPHDGERIRVRNPYEPLRLADSPPAPVAVPIDMVPFELAYEGPMPRITSYRLAGWHEAERVWVFAPEH